MVWSEPPLPNLSSPARDYPSRDYVLACRIPGALGAVRALDEGFRHRSKRTFCRSRRDLAIGVVGTTAFHARPVRHPRTRIRDYVLGCRIFGALGAVRALDEGFRHRSKRTFSRSRRDLAIGVVGTTAFQIHSKQPACSDAEVEPSCSDREKTKEGRKGLCATQ